MQIAGIIENSLSNGTGTRIVIFLSGCIHNCKGCHNSEMQDMHYGEEMTHNQVMDIVRKNIPIITGVTLSGGDPFLQSKASSEIARDSKSMGLDVWTYTGYVYEDLKILKEANEDIYNLLKYTDVLVDGKFIKELKDDSSYKGSLNQRTIKLMEGEWIGLI